MSAQTQYYLVAVPAVIILGLSKGGFSGLSSLAMPLLSLVDSPVRAAAIVLPILIVQDWVSVWAFRRDFSSRNLIILIPASMIGVALGWLLVIAGSAGLAWLPIALGAIVGGLFLRGSGAAVAAPALPVRRARSSPASTGGT